GGGRLLPPRARVPGRAIDRARRREAVPSLRPLPAPEPAPAGGGAARPGRGPGPRLLLLLDPRLQPPGRLPQPRDPAGRHIPRPLRHPPRPLAAGQPDALPDLRPGALRLRRRDRVQRGPERNAGRPRGPLYRPPRAAQRRRRRQVPAWTVG